MILLVDHALTSTNKHLATVSNLSLGGSFLWRDVSPISKYSWTGWSSDLFLKLRRGVKNCISTASFVFCPCLPHWVGYLVSWAAYWQRKLTNLWGELCPFAFSFWSAVTSVGIPLPNFTLDLGLKRRASVSLSIDSCLSSNSTSDLSSSSSSSRMMPREERWLHLQ